MKVMLRLCTGRKDWREQFVRSYSKVHGVPRARRGRVCQQFIRGMWRLGLQLGFGLMIRSIQWKPPKSRPSRGKGSVTQCEHTVIPRPGMSWDRGWRFNISPPIFKSSNERKGGRAGRDEWPTPSSSRGVGYLGWCTKLGLWVQHKSLKSMRK